MLRKEGESVTENGYETKLHTFHFDAEVLLEISIEQEETATARAGEVEHVFKNERGKCNRSNSDVCFFK